MRRPQAAWWVSPLATWAVGLAALAAPAAADQRETLDGLRAAHRANLEGLALKCDELGLAAAARRTRDWPIDHSPRRRLVFFPLAADHAQPPASADRLEHLWWERFVSERRRHADELFQAAMSWRQREPRAAYGLLWEVLREDPSHARARGVLGVTDQWIEAPRVRRGGDSAPLGTPAGGRRMLRVESAHFVIFTAARGPGLQLAELLERLYAGWLQVYLEYWIAADSLANNGAPAADLGDFSAPRGSKHQVVLFQTRQEYLQQLTPLEPRVEATTGIYLEKPRAAYFYLREDDFTATWLHEATHQLFAEVNRSDTSPVARGRHIWAVEGAALYMESLWFGDDHGGVGGPLADRLQFARHRVFNEGVHVPFAELSREGRDDWQSAEISLMRRYYTQSGGLAAWIMDGRDATLRLAYMNLLRSVYAGREELEFTTLAEVSAEEVDRGYQEFLIEVDDEDMAFYRGQHNLCLTRTGVTGQGLKHLDGGPRLKWLDLSHTKATDQGLLAAAEAVGMEHLNLDRAGVTSQSLAVIRKFRKLEHLDLSNCGITDADLPQIAELSELRVLWLSGCPISDQGLPHLRALRKLETLHVDQTSVSPAALRKLGESLPNLQLEER